MNERIKELADQCYDPAISHIMGPWFDREKFAELLIEDCIATARITPELTIGQGYCVTLQIKKHFGVE